MKIHAVQNIVWSKITDFFKMSYRFVMTNVEKIIIIG